MSLLAGPNASRALLRSALRSVTSKASSTPQPFAPTRWISGCASQSRQGLASSPTARCRNAPFATKCPSYETRRTLFSDKTIRRYEDLPRDYRDQVGLPFRSLDLTESEVLSFFGRGINPKRANHLLRILHGRRIAGTLQDPAFAVHTASFTKDQIERALVYLRYSIPVEEVMNAGLRAEDELAQMEQEQEAAEARKTKQPAEKEEPTDAPAYKPDPVYGYSKFDEIRAKNLAKRKVQEAAEEEIRKAAEARGEVPAGPLANINGKQERQISNPRLAEYHKGAQSDLEAPPELKTWERILPSAIAVTLAIGFLASVASVYEEPDARFRIFPDISTAHATLGVIIALNVLVWAGWRLPPLWSFFNRYMIFVVATVKPITMFTSAFSHQKFTHLVMNMVPLWIIGSLVHEEIGRGNFLMLYVGCGAFGFLGSLATYVMRGLLNITSLGASGATLGLCSAYFWEHRNDGFKIFGLPQGGVHGIVFIALLFVPQLAAFGNTAKLKVDIASHIAGMLAGMAGIGYINRSRERDEKKIIDVGSGSVKAARLEQPWEGRHVAATK
ncbi:hypothetical protein FZEAL_7029 [Fusarium zealandicum]|uniref:Peptidase S54 rhomboid domain-containing protein n=1 Tax=Fusarium zealandicum TaxID=1053134 RepID=A0A8H4XI92_9HYPO|nr:hypothetical protein FZEAL_7029 [Fusarium zealandicum]